MILVDLALTLTCGPFWRRGTFELDIHRPRMQQQELWEALGRELCGTCHPKVHLGAQKGGLLAVTGAMVGLLKRFFRAKSSGLHHRRPQTVCAFQTETRACDAQSWETKDCVQSGRTHLKKELTSPNSKPFGELFFKCEHDAGHAAQSAGS